VAVFCHHDGTELRSGQPGGGGTKLLKEFAFPSGKRCTTFDDLAQACQDDWTGARDLLRKGTFVKFFSSVGRMDLARVAQESMGQANPDIGLSNLVSSMPVSRTEGPRLDLQPRRLILGTMQAGESRPVTLTVSNQGQGMLQGTLTITEGGEWLRIQGSSNGQCSVQTAREQQVQLQVDTRGLAAGQPYGARLTVVTNGGVVELPARLEVAAQPFPRAPFQGVRAQRELAERMRAQPKAAVPLLESGEIARWFETNGWNYPVRGVPAKGVAGVQQFFENMGLSRPPTVELSQAEAFHACTPGQPIRGQVTLKTAAKKWVYGNVESDAPWLRVLTPSVSGAQQAQIGYEIDARKVPAGGIAEAHLTVSANGGQQLTLRVLAQGEGQKSQFTRKLIQPVITCTLVFFLVRLALVPVLDVFGRGAAANAALARAPGEIPLDKRESLAWGGWLKLPWQEIYLNPKPESLKEVLGDATPAQLDRSRGFRDYFTGYVLRVIIGCTWWLGAVAGVFVLWRRGNVTDAPWGLLAGAAAGIVVSATVGSVVLVGDLGPHLVFDVAGKGKEAGIVMLLLWAVVAVVWWSILGFVCGVVLTLLGPLGRSLLYPLQGVLSGACRLVGLARLGDFFSPV